MNNEIYESGETHDPTSALDAGRARAISNKKYQAARGWADAQKLLAMGFSQTYVAKTLGVNASTVYRWKKNPPMGGDE